jgi:hypothetical protein
MEERSPSSGGARPAIPLAPEGEQPPGAFSVANEPVVEVEPEDEVTYICDVCGMEIPHEPILEDDRVYCCRGCQNGTGCTCEDMS